VALLGLVGLAGLAPRAAADVPPRPSAGCAHGTIDTGRRLERALTVDGTERRYVLDVPDELEAGRPVPLLFDFHGIGHSGAGVWQVSGFRALAPRERFVTVYPDGLPISFTRGERQFTGPGWEIRTLSPNRDVAFTVAMLETLERELCIDRARVYATGFSNGGYFSHVLACARADLFAAVAPVSGGWMPWACEPSRPVPVMIHHGRQDRVIDVAEARRADRAWREIDACRAGAPAASPDGGESCAVATGCAAGVSVAYCEGDFAHRWPADATERIWRFLRAYALPAS
jgi:polyhydroxybutyrate depolymerase